MLHQSVEPPVVIALNASQTAGWLRSQLAISRRRREGREGLEGRLEGRGKGQARSKLSAEQKRERFLGVYLCGALDEKD